MIACKIYMRKSQRSRSTVQIAFALKAVTENINRKRGFGNPGIINDWVSIVGANLADRTLPEKLDKNGTLRIRVDGPIATEIQHLEPQILDKVAVYFGYRAVRRLSIIQGPIEKKVDTDLSTKDSAFESIPSGGSFHPTIRAKKTNVKNALSQLAEIIKNKGNNS